MADPEEERPEVAYSPEGDGVVARCTACWWETWKPDQRAGEVAAADHKKCRAEDLAFVKRQRASKVGRR